MSNKLVVSHSGSQGVFGLIETDLLKQLKSHQTEWLYGHTSHRVNVEIVSLPFEVAITKVNAELSKQPVLHVFWTDAENESYRNHVKDQLTTWLERLQKHNCNNYLIVHATFQDKHAILHKFSVTKTSMSERVRNDFGSQRADRTVSFKAESNSVSSSQSWLITVGKVRDTILKSVTLKLTSYEKTVNQIRDTHEDDHFDLFKYISAKEELCALFETIGLYEEAYRSSEEVLSLFRQYISNLRHCQIVPWIMEYIECDITNWSGLNLSDRDNETASVKNFKQLNSLQLSSLIFKRIAEQLMALQNPRDLARKGLQFLHSVTWESKLLKARYPEGAMKVWVYIGCIELLEAVKKSSPTSLNNMDVPESLAVAKARLYDLARQKLHQLGELVGHIPSDEETLSEDHILTLINGAKRSENVTLSPQSHNISSDIAIILTNKSFFHKQYIDLCQLSIISFKQGHWVHHAQQVLLKQALYLRNRGIHTECLNAETFLRDVCHAYYTQGWFQLAAHSRVHLCETQRYLGYLDRELNTCCHLSTELEHLTDQERLRYSTRLVECIELLNSNSSYEQLIVPFSPLFQYDICDEDNLGCILIKGDNILVKNRLNIKIRIANNCSEALKDAVISLKLDTGTDTLNRTRSQVGDINDFSMVPIETSSEIMEDGLYGISLKADSELVKDENAEQGVKHMLLLSEHVTLVPGNNEVVIGLELTKSGTFGVSSLQIQVGSVVFRLKNPSLPTWLEEVVVDNEESSVAVDIVEPRSGVWVSGQTQYLNLSVFTDKAFHSLDISLKAPDGGIKLLPVDDGTYSVEDQEDGIFSLTETENFWNLTLPALMPNKVVKLDLPMICSNTTDLKSSHLIDISWSGGSLSLCLTFHLPFTTDYKLQFHHDRLYLMTHLCSNLPTNVTVTSIELSNPGSLTPVSPTFRPQTLIPQQKLGYIWTMDRTKGSYPKKGQIKVGYTLSCDLQSYEHVASVAVTPKEPCFSVFIERKTEHPNVGTVCRFQVTIHTTPIDKKIWRLLYGVEANQTQWAVCGYQRRQIDIADKVRFTVELLPLWEGDLEYPKIKLWEYREPQLQTVGNSKDLEYITSSEESCAVGLTPLSAVEFDPLGADSPAIVRKRSTSTLPRAEKIDYTGGKERIRAVNTVVLTTLTDHSLHPVETQSICSYNLLSLSSVVT